MLEGVSAFDMSLYPVTRLEGVSCLIRGAFKLATVEFRGKGEFIPAPLDEFELGSFLYGPSIIKLMFI